MFKNLEKITISGGGFPEDRYPKGACLPVFQNRLNLIYGKNGSGKSTIASAIKDWKEGTASSVRISFSPALSDTCKDSVFVFNEEFIQKNILEQSRGPQTIMMIGSDNVSAATRIQEIEEKIEQLNQDAEPFKKIIDELGDKKNPDSIDATYDAVCKILKADGNYAERATLIKNHVTTLGGKNKSRINEEVIDSITKAAGRPKPADMPSSISDLKTYLSSKIEMLSSVSSGQNKIIWSGQGLSLAFDAEEINRILAHEAVKPELNEREKRIFRLLEDSERSHYLRLAKKDIVENSAEFCPLCHQPIDDNARESLTETVIRLLSDEENTYRTSLSDALHSLDQISILFPAFPDNLYADDIKKCQGHLYEINNIIGQASDAINSKLDDLYSTASFRIDADKLNNEVEEATKALSVIADDVDEYNKLIDNNASLEASDELSNRYLAYLETKNEIEKYVSARTKSAQAKQKMEEISSAISKLKSEADNLGLKMKQAAIAHDYINTQLSNIFYSSDRLSLKGIEGGSYVLCSRGKPVPPGKVSTGERNIIALAYFFATLFSGKTKSSMYSDPKLVVIDDPVSSFDYGNRTGISAFLASEIDKILKGSGESKVLILSHDMHTISDLSKLSKHYNGRDASLFCELQNDRLIEFSKKDNEYWILMRDVFFYASGTSTSESEESGIGNKMRRLLETYSNFMFQCGFKDMLDKDYVCDSIPLEKRDYYKNFLGRFILDALSHAENQVNTLDFTESLFSREEKQANARNIMKFLYHTNVSHLRAYLKEEQFDLVESWAEEDYSK